MKFRETYRKLLWCNLSFNYKIIFIILYKFIYPYYLSTKHHSSTLTSESTRATKRRLRIFKRCSNLYTFDFFLTKLKLYQINKPVSYKIWKDIPTNFELCVTNTLCEILERSKTLSLIKSKLMTLHQFLFSTPCL